MLLWPFWYDQLHQSSMREEALKPLTNACLLSIHASMTAWFCMENRKTSVMWSLPEIYVWSSRKSCRSMRESIFKAWILVHCGSISMLWRVSELYHWWLSSSSYCVGQQAWSKIGQAGVESIYQLIDSFYFSFFLCCISITRPWLEHMLQLMQRWQWGYLLKWTWWYLSLALYILEWYRSLIWESHFVKGDGVGVIYIRNFLDDERSSSLLSSIIL